jgi:conjugal transfer pilus assembly protein TraW
MLGLSLFLSISCASFEAAGEDLGAVGSTYEIAEPDLIEVIRSRLEAMSRSGELARKQIEYRDRVVRGIERPKPIKGIGPTHSPRTFHVNPGMVLAQDIRDAAGQLLFAKGTQVNPLDLVSLSKRLIFFDARDDRQVAFVKAAVNDSPISSKPILVAGQPLELMRNWKRPVYFDQGGTLVKRFGIRQVPAIVSQDGKRLRIDEVRP